MISAIGEKFQISGQIILSNEEIILTLSVGKVQFTIKLLLHETRRNPQLALITRNLKYENIPISVHNSKTL